jgi:integral membrane protein (TIGR01906 family)
MRRAPAVVGIAFGSAVALAAILTGPLLLFAPPFVAALQQRHDVAARLGTSDAEVDRVTSELLRDLFTDGNFTATLGGEPVLDQRERSHMRDVGGLVRVLVAADLAALLTALIAGRALRREPRRLGRLLALAGSVVGGLALLGAVAFAVAFTAAFTTFHNLFFAPGTWLFGPDSRLIGLFPQPFWSDAALAAGTLIVATAALVGWLGWRRLHSAAWVAPS